MKRTMNNAGIKKLLYSNHDHPIWAQIASRCLTCANCTMVCPTCFCSNVEDVTDLKVKTLKDGAGGIHASVLIIPK